MNGEWKVEETNGQDFVEITSPDGWLRGIYDKDANVAYAQLLGPNLHHSRVVGEMRKILEFDENGNIHGVQFHYCSDGITMDEVPEEVREQAAETVRRLGITVRDR